jgi:SAM-dependent methyltransferase
MQPTSGRRDPLLVAPDDALDQAMLALVLARYKLAAEFVRDADVVDCACGTGHGSALLAQAGARSVQGVDLDRDALAFARMQHAHPAITYYEADACRYTPTPAPTVWVSVETVEHLPHPAEYVAHVAEVLPPGGRFIASVPVTVTTDGDPNHLSDFTRESFRALLKAHGFVEEKKLEQSHRFTLRDAMGGTSQRDRRRGLISWYVRHPEVFVERVKLTVTKGLVNEYLTIVARRR